MAKISKQDNEQISSVYPRTTMHSPLLAIISVHSTHNLSSIRALIIAKTMISNSGGNHNNDNNNNKQ